MALVAAVLALLFRSGSGDDTVGQPTMPGPSTELVIPWTTGDGRGAFLHRVPLDGSASSRLTTALNGVTDMELWPDYSPDGTRLAFIGEVNGVSDLFVASADGSNPRNITNTPEMEDQPRWSPNGTRILFLGGAGDEWGFYTVAPDGSDRRRLTQGSVSGLDAEWSPNGLQIAFTAIVNGPKSIYVIDADGSDLRQITHGYEASDPSWSSDGTRIAFTDWSTNEIAIMDADGGKVIVNTADGIHGTRAEWSPDGSTIAFSGFVPEVSAAETLFLMQPDGTGAHAITPQQEGVQGLFFVWSSDGRQIAWLGEKLEQVWTPTGTWTLHVVDADGTNGRRPAGGRQPVLPARLATRHRARASRVDQLHA